MLDEIQAGLKNALERGFSLDEAIQSFVSAGYNPVEVREAANNVDSKIATILPNKKTQANSAVKNMTNEQPNPSAGSSIASTVANQLTQTQKTPAQPTQVAQPVQQIPIVTEQIGKKSHKKLIIIILVILLLLALGILALTFLSQDLLQSFFGSTE